MKIQHISTWQFIEQHILQNPHPQKFFVTTFFLVNRFRENLGNFCPETSAPSVTKVVQERRLLWWTIPGRGTQQRGHHQADGQGSRGFQWVQMFTLVKQFGISQQIKFGMIFSWGCHGYIGMISQNTPIKV